ncbi:acetyltransferase [Paucisalibacillus globulus]|uniref:acetyltransferase n=1 Tax=Paucisalibacillus globulus TaxID=351095 RepID=UPI0003FDEAA8|nr:acetyltransferase [Paucisalibacillus globulus]
MEELLLIGGGGHCKSIIDTLSEHHYKIIGIIDTKENVGNHLFGIEVIGVDDDLDKLFNQGIKNAFISLGSIGDVKLRKKLFSKAKKIGYFFPTIIDSSAIVSNNAVLGNGTFIGKGAIINANVTIGNNVIVNSGSIIEHDCKINDFCHIAPGSTLSGNVKVKENTHVGTNSTIIENISIGSNTIIGAGSVVIKDISDNTIAYGNPCKVV